MCTSSWNFAGEGYVNLLEFIFLYMNFYFINFYFAENTKYMFMSREKMREKITT